MGKYKLSRNIVLGALTGLAISLFDRDSRQGLKSILSNSSTCMKNTLQDPVTRIRETKQRVDRWKNQFDQQSNELLNAVEQVQDTIQQIKK